MSVRVRFPFRVPNMANKSAENQMFSADFILLTNKIVTKSNKTKANEGKGANCSNINVNLKFF